MLTRTVCREQLRKRIGPHGMRAAARSAGAGRASAAQESMKIDFPYPGYEQITPADVPDKNLMGVFGPRSPGNVDETTVLARGIEQPIGAPRLRDAVRGKRRLLILIDDGTRMTP